MDVVHALIDKVIKRDNDNRPDAILALLQVFEENPSDMLNANLNSLV
jgi:hypothetical protein